MNAEIISVGTELLLGSVANTDAQDVSRALSELGINVFYHTVVGDNPDRLKSAVQIAKGRADIIIATGGLGPTFDDLTKQTLAECFGVKMVFHEEEAERIRGFFNRLGHMKMTENNLQQAWLPEGCTVFVNSCGTAPGCGFYSQGCHVLMLPGPPRECRAMIQSGVVPYLSALSDSQIVSHNIHTYGLGESAVEQELRPMMLEMKNPTLATYAGTAEMYLRLTAKAATREECETMMAPILSRLTEKLGECVYAVDIDSLEAACVKYFADAGKTVSCAESCTGGLLAKRLTDVPGSSAVLLGGAVTYSNSAKEKLLGVPEKLLSEFGAVSSQVARAMARGAMKLFGSDCAIGITGVAGPDGDGSGVPVGTVFIALADSRADYCCEMHMSRFDRDRVRIAASSHALDMLRRWCTGIPIRAERTESLV